MIITLGPEKVGKAESDHKECKYFTFNNCSVISYSVCRCDSCEKCIRLPLYIYWYIKKINIPLSNTCTTRVLENVLRKSYTVNMYIQYIEYFGM
jgi:hypothetical protein